MKIRLVKGLSYTTPSFSCKKGKEVTVPDKVGEELVKTGRFACVSVNDNAGSTPPADNQKDVSDSDGESTEKSTGSNNNGNGEELSAEIIEKMRKDELIALAEEKGIDISECSNNEERAEKIKGALGLVNMAQLFGE